MYHLFLIWVLAGVGIQAFFEALQAIWEDTQWIGASMFVTVVLISDGVFAPHQHFGNIALSLGAGMLVVWLLLLSLVGVMVAREVWQEYQEYRHLR